MAITVNGSEFTDAEVEAELPHHQDTPQPLRSACIALALKRVMLDEAAELGHPVQDAEEAADWLLSTQVSVPTVDETSCRRYYDQHPERFRVGGWVDADHILFAVAENTPLDALREFANETLALVRSHPERFEALAAERSNCPSSENGGALGQMVRGEAVPEFEAALWRITPGTIAEALIETRYGLHIVRVNRRDEGRQLPFEQVHEAIAQALLAASRDAAWRQYVQVLLGRAKIEGIDLEGADTPLVQ